jgi:predicted nucleic acid-binding protein
MSVLARRPRIPAHALIESRNLSGGAIYDALIAETAKRARATLFTRDKRAVATYEKIGVLFELLS